MTRIDATRAAKIAALNDRCRKAWGLYRNARVVVTPGILSLPEADQSAIAERVQTFDAFTVPYGEHDFGAFAHAGQRVFWKIDYYAPDLLHGAEDPANPEATVRVLTIMLADEY